MEERLTKKLNSVPNSYYGFVVAVLTYVKKKQERFDKVESFIDNNPNASAADIWFFISKQDDFYEDAAYAKADVC